LIYPISFARQRRKKKERKININYFLVEESGKESVEDESEVGKQAHHAKMTNYLKLKFSSRPLSLPPIYV
jgi:hypothetical protein